VAAQPDERHTNRTASVLEWFKTQKISDLNKKNFIINLVLRTYSETTLDLGKQ